MSESEAGWLCGPEDAPSESWLSDVYWRRANVDKGHIVFVRNRDGVRKSLTTMEFVRGPDRIEQIFYGNPCAPYPSVPTTGELVGFSSLYNTRDPRFAQNAVNVLDGGGRGETTSAWLIGWGPRTIYLVTVDGQPLTVGGAEIGLVVADWRHAVRIANINASVSREKIEALLIQALAMLPRNWGISSEQYRATIYVNPIVKQILAVDHFRQIFVRDIDLHLNEKPILGGQEHAA